MGIETIMGYAWRPVHGTKKWMQEQCGEVDGLILPFRNTQPVSKKVGSNFLSFSLPPQFGGSAIERSPSAG
jgi:hypothetical protein